ncbi:hypothetical protein QBC33DRAFT_556176 [Phialemonium atrogriseum]|uniref:Uncharacterized protein n=1 Tax=Phialemonium atrogriseum TaxID=1093897 RepID=A0AAJ0C674_9PEZI|nr:uncharacterized protein QBC33DRAFT_556176 [Phialemonium atrogriseum]KAK1770701.1 hypothetical protein QBC33DRAFT_556176 [Phialemonium atrogriseum]
MSSRSSRPPKTHYGSSSSVSSYSASDSDISSSGSARRSMDPAARPVASVEVLRCLRCARAVEITSTDDLRSSGMVRIGTNIYYCDRCAKMVGYK